MNRLLVKYRLLCYSCVIYLLICLSTIFRFYLEGKFPVINFLSLPYNSAPLSINTQPTMSGLINVYNDSLNQVSPKYQPFNYIVFVPDSNLTNIKIKRVDEYACYKNTLYLQVELSNDSSIWLRFLPMVTINNLQIECLVEKITSNDFKYSFKYKFKQLYFIEKIVYKYIFCENTAVFHYSIRLFVLFLCLLFPVFFIMHIFLISIFIQLFKRVNYEKNIFYKILYFIAPFAFEISYCIIEYLWGFV